VALKLDIRTSGGDKVKLMLMRGGGSGVMGSLAGGEGQRDGVAALANWFERAGA
jgi:hypothetical protein